jgi:hypothetical protein
MARVRKRSKIAGLTLKYIKNAKPQLLIQTVT